MQVNKLLAQSTAVRTNVLSEVRKTISRIPYDLDNVTPYKTNIVQWLHPIIDLSNFYVYPMNGITQGLDWWLSNEKRKIFLDDGDYQWVPKTATIHDSYIHYISCPSSIHGNYRNIPTDVPVALDLAYIGSTKIIEIKNSDNIEYVFYSLSKSFGIRNIRTGWFFSRTQDNKLENLINSAKYYNYIAHNAAEEIIKTFNINYVYDRLNNLQYKICDKLDLTPSDSVWLATSNNPIYNKFKRTNNINRISLSPLMAEYNE